MEINIKWVGEEVEIDEKIFKNGVEYDIDKLDIQPCHDLVVATLEGFDKTNQIIKGIVRCECGKELYTLATDHTLEVVKIEKL